MKHPRTTTTAPAQEAPRDYSQLQRARLLAALEKAGKTAKDAAAIIGTTPATFSRKARKPSSFTTGEAYALAAAGIISKEDFYTVFFPEFTRDALRDGVRMSLDLARDHSLAALLCDNESKADIHLAKAWEGVERAAVSAGILVTDYNDPAPLKEVKALRRTLRKISKAPAPATTTA